MPASSKRREKGQLERKKEGGGKMSAHGGKGKVPPRASVARKDREEKNPAEDSCS